MITVQEPLKEEAPSEEPLALPEAPPAPRTGRSELHVSDAVAVKISRPWSGCATSLATEPNAQCRKYMEETSQTFIKDHKSLYIDMSYVVIIPWLCLIHLLKSCLR